MSTQLVKDSIHKLQLILLDGIHTEDQLFAAGCLLSRTNYTDVVIERSIANLCGYPLCNHSLPSSNQTSSNRRFRISRKDKEVLDLRETTMYCSFECVKSSRSFADYLPEEECLVATPEKVKEVFRLFGSVEDEGEKGRSSRVSELKIEEKMDLKSGVVPFEDFMGPFNAIEGYVPLREQKFELIPWDSGEKGTKKEKGNGVKEMDRTGSKPTKTRKDKKGKSGVTEMSTGSNLKGSKEEMEESKSEQFEGASSVPVHDISELKVSKPDLNRVAMESQVYIPKLVYSPTENVSSGDAKESGQELSIEETTQSNGTTLKSSLRSSDAKTLRRNVTWADDRTGSKISGNLCEFSDNFDTCESQTNSNTEVKSSPRSSAVKNLRRNVTWAEKRKTNVFIGAEERKPSNVSNENLCEVHQVSGVSKSAENPGNTGTEDENGSERLASAEACALALSQAAEAVASGVSDVTDAGEDENGSERLASAEACALALSQAAEAVASGVSDVTDAVSEAGIVILPQKQDIGERSQNDNMFRQEAVPLKISKNRFDLNDDLFDEPPEGFSLTLSTFSTMWMALFEWITSSSVACIYGKDENSIEEILLLKGKHYPCKVFSSEGRSSEIKLTLAVCLGRALPEVATVLRLKTPISVIEKELDLLLSTMTLMGALPPFKFKQWHVIALLFMDALSVYRVPGLASQITGGRTLLCKVLDGAKISEEEYAYMRDLILPFGRVPEFSAEMGG